MWKTLLLAMLTASTLVWALGWISARRLTPGMRPSPAHWLWSWMVLALLWVVAPGVVRGALENLDAGASLAQVLGIVTAAGLLLLALASVFMPGETRLRFGLRWPTVRQWCTPAFALGLVGVAAMLLSTLWSPLSPTPAPTSATASLSLAQCQSLTCLLGLLLLAGCAVPIVEEFIFRGLTQGQLRAHLGAAGSIAISAVAFGVAHVNVSWAQFLGFLVLGIVLASCREASQSIAPSALIHALFNIGVLMKSATSAAALPQ